MSRRLRSVLGLAACCLVPFAVGSAQETAVEYGIGLTPAHFPDQTDQDIVQMFRHTSELAGLGVINVRWEDTGSPHVAEQMSNVARQFGLKTMIQLDVFEAGQTRLAPPRGVSAKSFDAAFSTAYLETVRQLAAQKPAYLMLAVDINRLLADGVDRLVGFAAIYKQAYRAAKQVSPDSKVFVGFSWDIFQTASIKNRVSFSELRKLVDQFRPELDVLAFSSTPSDPGGGPGALPPDFFAGIREFASSEEIALQTGWPSGSGGEAAQAAFIGRLPALTSSIAPKLMLWPILSDLPFPGLVGTLGLYNRDGVAKSAVASFRSLSRPGTLPTAVKSGAPQPEASRRDPSDKFTLWISPLSGKDPVLVASDPKREINHARVSPARDQLVFTRYNVAGPDGEAREGNSYFQTEAVVCRIDGSNCEVMLPAQPGVLKANANWTPDGQHLIFVTNDNPTTGLPGIALLDLSSHQITMIPSPPGMVQADPQMVDHLIVSPGRPPRGARYSVLRLYDTTTKTWRQLSSPDIPGAETEPLLGDHDPKLSADGRYVAVMRHMAKDDWAIIVIDVATGAERNLSDPHSVDAVPEWSSDGKLITFWHVDRSNLKNSGIYTMTPDGKDRRRVPLPHGFFYTMPAFFPKDGSGPEARIIYSAAPEPRM